jgi:hypothetical protein
LLGVFGVDALVSHLQHFMDNIIDVTSYRGKESQEEERFSLLQVELEVRQLSWLGPALAFGGARSHLALMAIPDACCTLVAMKTSFGLLGQERLIAVMSLY